MKLLFLYLGFIVLLLIGWLESTYPKDSQTNDEIIQAIQLFRKERDHFFKTAPNSPLEESDKIRFKGLHYFPIDLKYRFEGKLKGTLSTSMTQNIMPPS